MLKREAHSVSGVEAVGPYTLLRVERRGLEAAAGDPQQRVRPDLLGAGDPSSRALH